MPKVSVLLPVYNGEDFLKEAIESILSQTFTDFEFIIIDDGSTDGTSAILKDYQKIDNRIIVHQYDHRGLIQTLNEGCRLAHGDYIARMDADDISLPERLEKQVDYMEKNPDIGVLGCGVKIIDSRGKEIKILRFPKEHGVLKFRLCFYNALTFAHPAVLMRRTLIEEVGGYNAEAIHSEDYELWRQLSKLTRFSNLQEVLFCLRKHESNITRVPEHIEIQIANGIRINQRMVSEVIGEEVPIEFIKLLYTLEFKKWNDLKGIFQLIRKIYNGIINEKDLSNAEKQKIRIDAFRHISLLLVEILKKPLRNIIR